MDIVVQLRCCVLQVEELFKLQNKHNVDIMWDKKKSAVTVSGIDIDVAKATSNLKDIMLSATTQRHLAAGMPPVRWQYQTGKDKFADFDPENIIIIEAAFKKKEREVVIQDKRGQQYKIDFKDRKEYCISDRHAPPVAVKRRDLLQGTICEMICEFLEKCSGFFSAHSFWGLFFYWNK